MRQGVVMTKSRMSRNRIHAEAVIGWVVLVVISALAVHWWDWWALPVLIGFVPTFIVRHARSLDASQSRLHAETKARIRQLERELGLLPRRWKGGA